MAPLQCGLLSVMKSMSISKRKQKRMTRFRVRIAAPWWQTFQPLSNYTRCLVEPGTGGTGQARQDGSTAPTGGKLDVGSLVDDILTNP